jgi:hypothetical protein
VSRAAAVTVPANNVTFLDLRQDARPTPVPDATSDAELLVLEVIELKNQNICFSAVTAWVLPQILDHGLPAFLDDPSGALRRLLDVLGSIRLVMLAVISGLARSAVGEALALRLVSPGEVFRWLLGAAPHAPTQGLGWEEAGLLHHPNLV